MRLWAALGAALGAAVVLAACSSEPAYPTARPEAQAPSPPSTPSIAPPLQTPLPSSRSPAKDQCGAAAAQGLVGRPRTEIPVPVDPNRQRVACTTCPVTEDFDPGRLNFFFDPTTGTIREVRCG